MIKSLTYRFIILLFCGFSLAFPLVSQEKYPAEKVELMTDRGFYISGESLMFSGIVSLNGDKNILSEVVYIEFISPSGQKINQTKVEIINNRFEGQLIIPQDALSGYYYIRAYTKWSYAPN